MNALTTFARAAGAGLCVLLVSCSAEPISGPPTVKIGRDECAQCGMLIGDDRACSGLLLDERGRRSYRVFDDIGCMLDFERANKEEAPVLERYVRDRDTRAWVAAESAHFVPADPARLPTPMGSGIGAFQSAQAAERAGAELGAGVVDYRALVVARAAWMNERHPMPEHDR